MELHFNNIIAILLIKTLNVITISHIPFDKLKKNDKLYLLLSLNLFIVMN